MDVYEWDCEDVFAGILLFVQGLLVTLDFVPVFIHVIIRSIPLKTFLR